MDERYTYAERLCKLLLDNLSTTFTGAINTVIQAGSNLIGIVDVSAPTAATIYNVTLTNANNEYSQALPAGCRQYEFQARTEQTVRFSNVTGKVATPTAPYITLKPGDYFLSVVKDKLSAAVTLYFASPTAGTVVEIIAWS